MEVSSFLDLHFSVILMIELVGIANARFLGLFLKLSGIVTHSWSLPDFASNESVSTCYYYACFSYL